MILNILVVINMSLQNLSFWNYFILSNLVKFRLMEAQGRS